MQTLMTKLMNMDKQNSERVGYFVIIIRPRGQIKQDCFVLYTSLNHSGFQQT
jgi:hypothetical protein